ncbi:uncharacterized protein LACBIDRAFT_305971 [Laccaria bicolor S238N-H82]|uniref:Predicted protein n=1 Tax=Laccaria bicolor (strain S238N-H82 / ATCC MYA-4686) TaxID=486041 RepID=B0CSD7_LACBS|nr:uncharacterized protein LACBIDRAFT_305971 [Laccaria bicolor S238N-H82]EDR14289.1 predicted protein [Laccaria bicolor S238N-H82]|eukprot:XP_001874848.1 predicted protein [Laccaria bicolor S238N-H82]
MAVEPLLATKAQRAFIGTVTIQAIVVLVMVGITFNKVDEHVDLHEGKYTVHVSLVTTWDKNSRFTQTLPCYLALFALAELFELFMAFDALRLRNIIQLIGLLIFHLALVVSAALQVHQTKSALVTLGDDCGSEESFTDCGGSGTLWAKIQPFLIVAPCVIGLSWFLMIFFVRKLYAEFGWAIFHVVGANPKMKTMYQWYQIMICLLKFDFFFFSGVTMQLLIVVLQRNSAEYGVTIAAIPVVLILLILCGLAVQREVKWIMSISLVMMLAASSYLYKLVRFYEPSSQAQYQTTRATLTVFTIVAFILLIGTFAVGLRCFADFDRGLQASKINAVPSRPKLAGEKASSNQAYQSGAPLGPRISIE